MEFIPLHIKDAYIVNVKLHQDHRGHLAELFNMNAYPEDITKYFPVQQVTWSSNHKVGHFFLYTLEILFVSFLKINK